MTLILGLIIIPLLFLYSAFSWGYVTHMLYNWFILSSFSNLPHFTTLQFIGFSFFLNTLIRSTPTHLKDEYSNKQAFWGYMILGPWFVLVLGWAFHALYF